MGHRGDTKPVSGGGFSENGKFSYGYASSLGKRSSMEDFHETRIDGVDGETVGLFGVFDGHGGARAAEFVKQNLFSNLIKHPKFFTDTKSAIAETFTHTDSELLKADTTHNRDAGSTASTAILIGDRLVVANVGDSRAVICRGGDGGLHLMSCLKDVPTLKGDNYTEWRKKVDLAFICAEVDWVVDEPQPVRPTEPVRESTDDDAAWNKKKSDHAPIEMKYTLENQKWINANKKCMAFIKNTIENAIVGSIAECTSAGELLTKIKSQFTGSSKTYATQLIKQLVTTDYTGGGTGIREHILRMSNMASKLKPMDADLEIKPALLVHLVMASLPKHFDTFVVNYNMSPEKWDIEKTIAMCVQEEDRLKASNGGSLNYVRGKQKKFSQSDKGSPSKPYGKASTQHQQKSFSVDKDTCLHCKQKGHYKKDCADWLKSIMAKKGIPFDENYAKKRKMH